MNKLISLISYPFLYTIYIPICLVKEIIIGFRKGSYFFPIFLILTFPLSILVVIFLSLLNTDDIIEEVHKLAKQPINQSINQLN